MSKSVTSEHITEKIFQDAQAIVREAGAIAMRFYKKDYEVWDKGKAGPVTEADFAVDHFLHEELPKLDLGAAWLSEESEDDGRRLTADRVWVVDPIDGTRAFVKGKPFFAISVALSVQGASEFGVVFNPAKDQLFAACRNKGATLNGSAIEVRDRDQIEGMRFIVYESLLNSERWRKPWPEVQATMFNSIAYRLACVASGEYHACLSINPKSDWDIAAAHVILEEAGAKISDCLGAPLLYNQPKTRLPSILAAGPALHGLIVEKMADFDFGDRRPSGS